MKNKNKFKLFAATVALAGVSAPIITLASCAKAPAIDIEEKEKTKELESGVRQATYTFKLDSAIQEGETFDIELSDIESSQKGYTVTKNGDPEYSVGSKEVKLNVAITAEDENAILDEGAKFTFNATLKRINAEGKVTATAKFEKLSMTYGSVPTTTGLKLSGAKSAYSNPGSTEHTFAFTGDSTIVLDKECTFEVDVTTRSTSTSEFKASFVKAEYSETSKKLFVTFALNQKGTETGEEHADFDFTICCQKEGNELWRQTFTEFSIKYLYHQMYIFEEIQKLYWPATYAGEKEFHIYIARNSEIHWGDREIQPSIKLENIQGAASMQIGTVTEPPKGEHYFDYFDVPVTITPTDEDTDSDITFNAVVSGKIDGEVKSNTFPLSIKYVAKKLNDSATKKEPWCIGTSTGFFEFVLNDTNTVKIDATLNQTTPTTHIKAHAYNTTITDTNVRTVVQVVPKSTNKEDVGFDLSLKGKDNTGAELWEQRIKGLKIKYVDPIQFESTTIKTQLGENSAIVNYSLVDSDVIVTSKSVELDSGHSSDIESLSIEQGTGNTYVVTMTPKAGQHFTQRTFAPFSLKVGGTYGQSAEPWEKQFAFRLKYEGFVSLVSEATPAIQNTKPGERTIKHTFKKYTDYKLKAYVADGSERGTVGYKVSTEYVDNGTTFDFYTTIKSTEDEFVKDGAFRTFNITFEALDSEGEQVWEQTYMDSDGTTPLDFRITYKTAVTTNDTDIYTTPHQTDAKVHLQNVGSLLKDGEYFDVEVVDQSKTSGILVDVPTKIYKPTTADFDVGITISKETPLVDRDYTNFNLSVKKCSADGTAISLDKVSGFKVTYLGNTITWDTDYWYVADTINGDTKTSETKNIKFNLGKALAAGEQLYATVTVTDASSTNIHLVSTYRERKEVTPSGTNVEIPMNLTTEKTYFTVGDYVKYSIKFECVNGSKTIWTDTITDTCLYMLTKVNCQTPQKTTEGADLGVTYDLGLKAEITQEMISSGAVKITATAKNISDPSAKGLSVHVGNPTFKNPLTLAMSAYFEGPTPASADYVTFDVDVKFETAYGSVTFTLTGFKITKL